MPQTYSITAPNGKTLDVTGDHVPTEAELQEIFKAAGVDTVAAAKSAPLPEMRMPAGVPARGRGTQLDPEKSWRGVEMATTPLAHPTGIGAIDNMTSPVGLASIAIGGAGIARSALAPAVNLGARALAGAKATLGTAAPVVKYEFTKSALERLGVPAPLAMTAAIVVSGYHHGKGKGGAAAAEAPAQTGTAIAPMPSTAKSVESPLELSRRIKAEYRATASPVETVSGGIRPPVDPPPASIPPGSGRNAYPDQKALNAEALARHRAAYQARAGAAAPVGAPPTPVVAKPTLSAAESKAYLQMRVLGKTDAQARQVIEASRALNDSLGLKTPTKAETRFPKGMRGKYQPPSE